MLCLTVKKEKQWICIESSNGEKLRVLVKNHKSGNMGMINMIFDGPRSMAVTREDITKKESNELIENHGNR